jgi:MoxR-like ATPase
VDSITTLANQVSQQCQRIVMGSEQSTELLLVALLCEGHVILEGVPGTGKTLLARTYARSLQMEFKRVQFTPDLMPADILGSNIFNFKTNQFLLQKGPIFTEFLMADEINRTPPKTQAALLESMQEHSVTIDGTSHHLSPLFLVVATQNPIEQEGTYPLPEAQLDRFLFKIDIGYPSEQEEQGLVKLHGHQSTLPDLTRLQVSPVLGREQILAMRQAVQNLHLSDELIEYIVTLIRATRGHNQLQFGASPRAANMLATAARALAALRGRDYAVPDDIKELFLPTLRHRVVMTASAHIEGSNPDNVLRQVLETTPAPR